MERDRTYTIEEVLDIGIQTGHIFAPEINEVIKSCIQFYLDKGENTVRFDEERFKVVLNRAFLRAIDRVDGWEYEEED